MPNVDNTKNDFFSNPKNEKNQSLATRFNLKIVKQIAPCLSPWNFDIRKSKRSIPNPEMASQTIKRQISKRENKVHKNGPCSLSWIQPKDLIKRAFVGQKAPYFEGIGHYNSDYSLFTLSQFQNQWLLLYFLNKEDFVNDIVQLSKLFPQLDRMGVKLVGVSSEGHFNNFDNFVISETGMAYEVNFPLLSDFSTAISIIYGKIGYLGEEKGEILAGFFLINKTQNIVKSCQKSTGDKLEASGLLRIIQDVTN